MCTGFVGFGLASHPGRGAVDTTISMTQRDCAPRHPVVHGRPNMNPLALRIALPFSLALACSTVCSTTYGQALATYGDAPAAEAEGAAAASSRASNSGAMGSRSGDASLLGAPATYGEVYRGRTMDDDLQQDVPAAAADPQGPGISPVEHMLTKPGTPQSVGSAIPAASASNAGSSQRATATATATGIGRSTLSPDPVAAAAKQLYGDGTSSGAIHHDIYRSPW
jgi:hypothetical protein